MWHKSHNPRPHLASGNERLCWVRYPLSKVHLCRAQRQGCDIVVVTKEEVLRAYGRVVTFIKTILDPISQVVSPPLPECAWSGRKQHRRRL